MSASPRPAAVSPFHERLSLHRQHADTVSYLLAEWAHAIDQDRVEDIAALMRPDGRYTVMSRFNHDRGLPMAIIDAHSAAQLRDRIKSMRLANIYQPQNYRHVIGGMQVMGQESSGLLQVRSTFMVVRTLELLGDSLLFASGESHDLIDIQGPEPRFAQRRMIFDSRAVETLMIIPI
jgi:3-phenylpropionate/cinnamic acid dioxygenase small subunit